MEVPILGVKFSKYQRRQQQHLLQLLVVGQSVRQNTQDQYWRLQLAAVTGVALAFLVCNKGNIVAALLLLFMVGGYDLLQLQHYPLLGQVVVVVVTQLQHQQHWH